MDEFEVIGGRQLYQWDTDRSIEVRLCDGETINEVHYAHAEDDIAPVVKVQDYDGRMFADIPNILLQRFGTLKVWAVVHTEDGRQTLRNAYLSVRARAKPDDYVYTETEIMDYRKVAEDLAELVQRVEEIEENGVQGGGAVASVNGKTGEVYLNAADVGALPTTGGKLTGNLTVPRLISTAADADGNIYEVQLYPTANGGLYMPLRHNGAVANAMSMSQSATTFGKPVAISSGGHGGKNAAEGRQNLSLYSKEEIDEKITNTQKEIERLTEEIEELDSKVSSLTESGLVKIDYDNSSTPMFGTYGYIDGQNGTFAASTPGRATDFIDISAAAGGKIAVSAMFLNNWGAAFYAADKKYISGICGTDLGNPSSVNLYPIEADIPENAYYFRCSGAENSTANVAYNYPDDFAIALYAMAEEGPLERIDKKYATLVTQEADIVPPVLIGQYVDNSTGEVVHTSTWVTTDYIRLSEATHRKVAVRASLYNNIGVAFYDAYGKFLQGVCGNTTGYSSSTTAVPVTIDIPEDAHYMRASMFIDFYANPTSFGVKLYGVSTAARIALDHLDSVSTDKAYNVLVLGDSYSEMGYWIDGLRSGLNVAEVVNLGVVSATLKDRQTDRTAYPYTDRPTSSGTHNQNTLASQVQKLKRLMDGTDLDEGESRVYVDTTPDVIIIEGGMNDSPDTDDEWKAYGEAFIVEVEDVYYKNSSGSVAQGKYYIKPDVENVDRTTFAGAYRYIVEELLTLFPDAQIFITTAARFNYFTTNPQNYDKIAKQQIDCARYCSASVIDWNGEGNLNTIINCPRGSGTEGDPYTVYGGTKDTTDGLHPNPRGGRVYGRLAAKVIRERFVGIGG